MPMHKLSRLKELTQQRHVIRITPTHRPDEKLYGIPLAVSDELILLHEVREFHLDGYLVLPLANIHGVRLKEAEITMHRILTAEGALANLGLSDPVSLSSFADFFSSLQACGLLVSIEACEPQGKFYDDFFVLGKITDMDVRNVFVLPFDAAAQWEPEPVRVPLKRILTVTFNNEYMNTFAKYVGRPPV